MLDNLIDQCAYKTMVRARDVYGAYPEVRNNGDGYSIFRYSKRKLNEYVIVAWFREELRKELLWYKK